MLWNGWGGNVSFVQIPALVSSVQHAALSLGVKLGMSVTHVPYSCTVELHPTINPCLLTQIDSHGARIINLGSTFPSLIAHGNITPRNSAELAQIQPLMQQITY